MIMDIFYLICFGVGFVLSVISVLGGFAHFHLGLAYVQTGDWPKARDEFKRAFALKPDLRRLPEVQTALAMIGA